MIRSGAATDQSDTAKLGLALDQSDTYTIAYTVNV